ncbi:HAD-IIIA family hydrolase [Fimbriimonas ginsengisoli]|uniref:Phosphoheptose isomerase n=1 Tax=Fimbriimonas ginsengisoli Gsoil 348 TaxID=661478 RepID=A0A068NMY1_FIMGI|nr:HAD-IIIA family hydrolase [Fimbriimonas ginsengisoli]AIE84826.1 phosphoheptose isomerase [Fimbriimonas ginsengisoli Gsoil 348]
MARPFLLLDRDGTLIEERGYLSDPAGVALTPGAGEALRFAMERGLGIAVVSNQSGIGRGMMTVAQVEAVNRRTEELLIQEGVEIGGFFFCPHHPDDRCACRKPGTGLALRAARELEIDLLRSVVVGDKSADLELGHAIGARSVLVRTGYGRETEAEGCYADAVIEGLSGLAPFLETWTSRPAGEHLVNRHLEESARVKLATRDACVPSLLEAAGIVAEAMRSGGKLLICGNGGSAADSQHLAAEFVVRLSSTFERRAWPAIALTTDTSILTAFGNDYGFERVFARQVEALGQPGDVLLAISTSGGSPNILRAAETARAKGLKVISLLGGTGGALRDLSDAPIVVPSRSTQHVQEAHLALYHLFCGLVERMLYPFGE